MSYYYIRVDKRTSRLVQEALFNLGWEWRSNDNEIRLTDHPFLIISESDAKCKVFAAGSKEDVPYMSKAIEIKLPPNL